MKFNCDKCGICCRNLNRSDLYTFLDRGDGVCKYLTNSNLCSIYDERPILCQIDKAYEIYFKETLTKEEYYQLNYNACIKLKYEFSKRGK